MFYDTRMNDLFNNGWIGSLPFVESYSISNPTASDPTATFSNPLRQNSQSLPRAHAAACNRQFHFAIFGNYL